MTKKKMGMFGFLISSLIINASLVFAQDDIVTEWLRFIFIDLSELAQGGDEIFVLYMKIILFFLVFSVIFWSAEKVFSGKRNISAVVAFVIALVSVMLLPGDIILLIFKTYSAIIGYVFILLPVIIGAILANKLGEEAKWHPHVKRVVKAIVYFLIAWLTFTLSTTLMSYDSEIYYDVASWAKVGGMICIFVGLYYLITMGKKEGETKAEK